MKFIADLHIHSKYSRATAKNLDLENVYIAAQKKGITVVGTGDFTHPQWFSELKEKLIPAEPGLFQLKDEIAKKCDQEVPDSCKAPVRFLLESEISNIYKKNGKTRKNHNLVYFPNFEKAVIFNHKLDRIGNIQSDGRPILGIDSKHLLEIMLEITEEAYLVPAHIWTPWFSLLGSKSGFDSIEECFEELSPYIFAAETGLSSDPSMNRRVSNLDRITLISNSDAHSPMKLGREANLFDTGLDYYSIKKAMESGDSEQFLGTFEFYPEEGKYHLDGHRKCNVRFRPEESKKHNGICPVCGKPLTLGVLYRVEALADRKEGYVSSKHHPYYNIVPLQEILSELFKMGTQSKKVKYSYEMIIQKLGSEFDILHNVPLDQIESAGVSNLRKAIQKLREGKITLFPGYDGEFGKIQIFSAEEIKQQQLQKSLFVSPELQKNTYPNNTNQKTEQINHSIVLNKKTPDKIKNNICKKNELNDEQLNAVLSEGLPLLIVAGPGTGKTLTLTHKISYFMCERGVSPENILAVTFTNKASQEMTARLKRLLGDSRSLPFVATFHSLCFSILRELENKNQHTIIDEDDQKYFRKEAYTRVQEKGIKIFHPEKLFSRMIVAAKQNILEPLDNLKPIADEYDCSVDLLQKVYGEYQNILSAQGIYDYEDLIVQVVKLFETDINICQKYRERYTHIFIDEYQDLNQGQYRIVRALAPDNKNLFVIGDPDQSIYGFRGSDVQYFKKFLFDYPQAKIINLTRNYRSTETILQASFHVIRDQHDNPSEPRVFSEIDGKKTISVMNFSTEKSEAVAIGKIIEQMVGGLGMHSIDFGMADNFTGNRDMSFSDFAILYRTNTQGNSFGDVFQNAGIPYQMVNRDHAFLKPGIRETLSLLRIVSGFGSCADFQRVMQIFEKKIALKTSSLFKNWCFQNQFSLEQALNHALRFPVPGMSRSNQLKLTEFINKMANFKQTLQNMHIDQRLLFLCEQAPKIRRLIQQSSCTEESFSRLLEMANFYQNNIDDFFEMVSLCTDVDAYDFKSEKVTLMTMHAAKGLEFPVVFVAGCEEGLIPYKRAEQEITDIDEEKRLFYVAMTRAKEHLFLTHATKRLVFGKSMVRNLSPFVYEIENQLRSHEKFELKKSKKENHPKQVQLELFS
ncbi:MAG: DNA helicase [Desulfobacterium sp.]|nr:DNA helicase [Desulfobacterium sp.]